jgi:hypothetical protein
MPVSLLRANHLWIIARLVSLSPNKVQNFVLTLARDTRIREKDLHHDKQLQEIRKRFKAC